MTQYCGGLRSALGYCGCRSIADLKKRGRFFRVSLAGLAESHPGSQPSNETVPFRQLVQGVHHVPPHHAEIPGIQRDVDAGQTLQQPVVQVVAESLEGAFLPLGANGVDDIPAGAHLLQEGQQGFRRILEIGVDNRHDIAPRVHEARGNGRLMPEISRQGDHLQPLVNGQTLQDLQRPVAASVVHNHQLEVFAPRGTGGAHPAIQFLDAGCLVVCWDHKRNHIECSCGSGRQGSAQTPSTKRTRNAWSMMIQASPRDQTSMGIGPQRSTSASVPARRGCAIGTRDSVQPNYGMSREVRFESWRNWEDSRGWR